LTLLPVRHGSFALTRGDLIRGLIVVAAVIIAIAALSGAFGLHELGPTYDIVPDPAGPLGF
jgi:hypothetical protein